MKINLEEGWHRLGILAATVVFVLLQIEAGWEIWEPFLDPQPMSSAEQGDFVILFGLPIAAYFAVRLGLQLASWAIAGFLEPITIPEWKKRKLEALKKRGNEGRGKMKEVRSTSIVSCRRHWDFLRQE